jgi:hypothetical protein
MINTPQQKMGKSEKTKTYLLDEDLTLVQAPSVDDPFKITEGTESDEQVDELSSTHEVLFPAWSFCVSPPSGTVIARASEASVSQLTGLDSRSSKSI